MEFPDARIMIFTRAPVVGQVKTRLIPLLGQQGSAELHERLVLRALHTSLEADLCPVQLWCAPDCAHSFLKKCGQDFAITLHRQSGPDLGARMARGFAQALQESNRALIIGTDCPVLSVFDLREALTNLADHPTVLGPAEDDGYVLIGLRAVVPSLFENIAWGSTEVLAATRDRLRLLHWRWHELPLRWDIDRPEDVLRMQREGLLDEMAIALDTARP